jgi:hypothetical protein
LRLLVALGCVSDFEYNDQTETYEPIDTANQDLSNVAYSGYLALSAAIAASTVVTATLPGSPTLTADASVLFCIGMEFYQKVGPNYYLFSSGNRFIGNAAMVWHIWLQMTKRRTPYYLAAWLVLMWEY